MAPRKKQSTASIDLHSQGNIDHGDASKPPAKRRRKTTGNATSSSIGRKKKGEGQLQSLPGMPIDILLEVFSHLMPLQLLQLSRTTKSLRNFLMSRSFSFLWKQAIARVESLPECPPDLTEPQYVRLMFEDHCTFCDEPNVHEGQWELRVRSCKSCFSARFTQYDYDVQGQLSRRGVPLSSVIVGTTTPQTRGKLSYLKSDLRELAATLKDILPDEKRFHEYLKGKLYPVLAAVMHGRRCEQWQITFHRAGGPHAARERRKEAIYSKLKALGWGNEVYDLSEHHLVRQSRDLSDRTWLKIKDDLIQALQDIKDRRDRYKWQALLPKRFDAFKRVVKEYYDTRPSQEVVPCLADIYAMPDFTRVIDLPKEVEVNEASFSEAMSRLPTLSAEWLQSVNRTLVSLIPPPSVRHNEPSSDQLFLATTFFSCCNGYDCSSHPRGYEQIVVHKCLTNLPVFGNKKTFKGLPGLDPASCCKILKTTPWQATGPLKFYQAAFEHARDIVGLCGKDPDATLALEMDKMDPRFMCTTCPHLEYRGMSWKQAVSHAVRGNNHRGESAKAVVFKLFDEADTISLKKLETPGNFWWNVPGYAWLCNKCREPVIRKACPCQSSGASAGYSLNPHVNYEDLPMAKLEPPKIDVSESAGTETKVS